MAGCFFVRPHNQPAKEGSLSDRQAAYQVGYHYIQQTKVLLNRMSPSDLKLWQEIEGLVAQYAKELGIPAS